MKGFQVAEIFDVNARAAATEAAAFGELIKELDTARAAVAAERITAAVELAGVYLPELTEDALERAGRLTGFSGFKQRSPLVAMTREHARLTQEVARIRAAKNYQDREALVGPAGSLVLKLAEAREFLAPWQVECDRFEALDGFAELVSIGYDTPAFAERWWQPVYWRHWSVGDRICEALGLADFGDDVLPAYHKVAEPRDRWKAEVARWEGEIAAVHELVRAHDAAVDRLQHLPEIYLQEARVLLGRHLGEADTALLASWAEGGPGGGRLDEEGRRAVAMLLKRVSGLNAKHDALGEMIHKWAIPTRTQLEADAAKWVLKREKLRRPKKRNLTFSAPPAPFDERAARYAQRRDKARTLAHRMVDWREYDRFHLNNDPALWWLLFTNGSPPGVYAPGLHEWYVRHPEVQVVEDPEWAERRGATATTEVRHHDAVGGVS